MSSLKMTFSLTSLILICALSLAVMPAMAADGGPTVVIADGQAVNKQTRAVFKIKFTFSTAVTGFDTAGDATYQYTDKSGNGIGAVNNITPVAVPNKPREYTADLDVSSPQTGATGFVVVVPADSANGNVAANLGVGNIRNYKSFNLPPQHLGKVVITAALDKTDTDATDGQDYDLTFTFKDTHATAGIEPVPSLTAEFITVEPEYITAVVTLGTDATDSATSGKDWVYKGSITHPVGSPDLTIGLEPSYVQASDVTTATVPPADDMSKPATAEVAISGLDKTERSFRIVVTFAGKLDAKGMAADETVSTGPTGFITSLMAEDKDEGTVLLTVEAERADKNKYTAILKYDRLATLPLTITVDGYKDTSDYAANPMTAMDAMGMVGMDDGSDTDEDPSVAIDISMLDTAARTFRVEVTLTPGMKADGTAGDAITDFDSTKLKVTDAGDADVTITVVEERKADNSYIAILGYNALAVLPLTVTTVDTFMTSDDPATSDMVGGDDDDDDENTAPTFASTTATRSIAENTAAGTDIGDPVAATDTDTGDSVTYTLSGTDAASFDINRTTGQLQTKAALDYETKTSYTVTVTATDNAGATDTIAVTINVTNVVETGEESTAPAAAITITNFMAATGNFDIRVVLTPATGGSAVMGFDHTYLTVMDSSTPARSIPVIVEMGTTANPVEAPLMDDNLYVATLDYDTRRNPMLPLKVTINQGMLVTSNPDHSADVGVADDDDDDEVVKAKATLSGTLSLTAQSIITITFDKAVPLLTAADLDVTGGSVTSLRVKPNLTAAMANKVWEVAIDPDDDPFTETITVTIASDSTAVELAATASPLTTRVPDGTLNSIAAATGANDSAAFIVSFTFAAALPDGVSLTANDIKVTPATATVGTPSASPADAKVWQVLITPTAGMDTTIELSDAGKLKFAYTGAAVTVMKATSVTVGAITATWDRATRTTTLTGTIGANSPTDSTSGFAVISAGSLPDLEEFFDIGGTIGLHDADTADGDDDNSREVIISEILWGLDFGATAIAHQKQWQFIELYNTTNAPIVLDNWTLKFTEGRPVPKKDVDQVSNRAGAGWIVDIGQSGRVTGTTAADATNLITPINVVSMYRNIDYVKVEKVKADGTADPSREEQLKGTKNGNAKGEWKVSTRRDSATPAGAGITGAQAARWIYASRGRQHYTTTAILTASAVARSPFIINEVGNGAGDTNDWVELRNVTSSEASLKNYHLSIVTGFDKDDSLVNFHDKDIKVPGNSVILLVNTDPKNTNIAAGRNAAVAETDQELTGVTSRYYVNSALKLPDDGKFNLILRNAHDKLKASSHFMDVIGGLVVTDDTKGTSLWPLVATGGPHGDVVEANGRDLKSGYVYIRKNAGGGTGEHHLGRAGYTGIGYDRVARKSDANGGTPGYDNGAVKDKIAGLTDGSITISEIMVDTGEARQSLAQWIELHNSSMTQAVSLNGWKLHIENAASANGELETNTFSAILTLGDIKISPNQTVLIASSTGRVSDPDHFPSTRVINLWTTKAHRDALEMVRRTDPVLSTTGFNITLNDKDGNAVDSAGNLDGNRRTRDEPKWMLPTSEDDGRRSSLLRVYDDGIAIKGTMKEAWVSADATNLAFAISQTFYGDSDDFGTPGFKAGGPLPVSLSKFRPERLKDTGEIVVRWITESELNNAGFNILRSEKRDGEFTKVHFEAGQGTTSERSVYEWKDTTAKPNVVYYYQIQDVSLDGDVTTLRVTHLRGNVTAAGKVTTTWGEIKALQ